MVCLLRYLEVRLLNKNPEETNESGFLGSKASPAPFNTKSRCDDLIEATCSVPEKSRTLGRQETQKNYNDWYTKMMLHSF